MIYLNKTLTEERARQLIQELGFLGIVDLVTLMSEGMNGSLQCIGPRVIVKIKMKRTPRDPNAKRSRKRVSRGEAGTAVPAEPDSAVAQTSPRRL